VPPVERADQAQRMPFRVHQIGDDVLFDCDLSAQARAAWCREEIDMTDNE